MHAPFKAVQTLCPDSANIIPATSNLPARVEVESFVPMNAFAVVVPKFATPEANIFPVELRKPDVMPVVNVEVAPAVMEAPTFRFPVVVMNPVFWTPDWVDVPPTFKFDWMVVDPVTLSVPEMSPLSVM